jgi:FMN phosphatase YigB (HAD superfamily)
MTLRGAAVEVTPPVAARAALAGVRAVLLDMGGVLLDMGNLAGLPQGRLDFRGREVLAREVAATGGRVTVEALEPLLFAPWRAAYEQRYADVREAAWEPHLRRLRAVSGARGRNLRLLGAWFAPYAATVGPLAGAANALGELAARGYPLALVSNVPLPGKLYERLLSTHGLRQPLRSLHWSYESGHRKPSPALPLAALAALGVPASEAVLVGDRLATDVAAGRAAGVRTVWLRSEHDRGPAPDVVIATLADLPPLLA